MDIYGLIGYPLGHSFSKDYFENMFKKEHINSQFRNFEIDSLDKFQKIIKDNSTLKGLSVTIPYKQKILNLLDEISPEAEAIGAVNSIRISKTENGVTCKGFNTDVYGFKESLIQFIGEYRSKALVLGTGGAARAIKYALTELGIEYLEVSRTPKGKQISYEQTFSIIEDYRIIINTTPLGMYPQINTFPTLPYDKMSSDYYLFDLTYNPEITSFMQKGMNNNAKVKNGLEMLHLQAEESWKLWNNVIF